MKLERLFLVLLASWVLIRSAAVAGDAGLAPVDERARWFVESRFGMFVHWGVYAEIGKGEWVRDTGKIPLAEYDKVHLRFNPTAFDAARWVAQAKDAGVRYIVITTKHHDGFCMFDSALTDYDIMSTPFRRDVMAELAAECRKQGIRLGFYYSIMDWHHPDYLPRRPWEKDRATGGADFARYIEYMRGQIRELMTKYGPIAVLWFDGGWERKDEADLARFREIIQMARQLQPGLLVNNRANIGGDFDTPEQYIPATGVKRTDGSDAIWEVCLTMTTGRGTFAPTAWWGYDAAETVFKPTDELVQKLIDVVSKGGNLLLNVGPEPTGKIRPEEAERLEGVGRWMTRNAEAIRGTSASPFRRLPFFGRVTRKGDMLYVHVFDWPADGRLLLPGLKSEVRDARCLDGSGEAIAVERAADGALLRLPGAPVDAIATVLALRVAEPLEVVPVRIMPGGGGAVDLPAHYAEIEAKHGQRAKPMSERGRVYIGNWSNPNDVVAWTFELSAAGTYAARIDARVAGQEAVGQSIEVGVGVEKLSGKIESGGVRLSGVLRLASGEQTLRVKLPGAKRTGPALLDLFGVRLVPER